MVLPVSDIDYPIQWSISSQMPAINRKFQLVDTASVSKTCLLHRKDHQVGNKSANQRFHMQIPHVILFMLDWF